MSAASKVLDRPLTLRGVLTLASAAGVSMTIAGPEVDGGVVVGVPDAPAPVSVGAGLPEDEGDSVGVVVGDSDGGGVGYADGVETGVQAASDPSRSNARRCARRCGRGVFTVIISLAGCRNCSSGAPRWLPLAPVRRNATGGHLRMLR